MNFDHWAFYFFNVSNASLNATEEEEAEAKLLNQTVSAAHCRTSVTVLEDPGRTKCLSVLQIFVSGLSVSSYKLYVINLLSLGLVEIG